MAGIGKSSGGHRLHSGEASSTLASAYTWGYFVSEMNLVPTWPSQGAGLPRNKLGEGRAGESHVKKLVMQESQPALFKSCLYQENYQEARE